MEEKSHRLSVPQTYRSIANFKERLRVIRHRILRNKLQKQGTVFRVSPNRALVFAPHADDETLGCGGFIALKRILNAPVEVVILTDGSDCFGSLSPAAATALIERREREAERAMGILGVPKEHLHFLKQPDGQLSVLTKRDRTRLFTQLVELLERYRPQEILVPHQLDNTADHEATFDLVHSALKATSLRPLVLQYPIWRFWYGRLLETSVSSLPDLTRVRRLEISQVLEKKREAFVCYESQHSSVAEVSPKSALPTGFQAAFELQYEVFFRVGDTEDE